MGLFSKDIKTMDDLFVHTLRDIYYAEQQIEKALPKMISKAADEGLRSGFEKHLTETRNQIQRLEQVFQLHGAQAKGVRCPAIDGIIEEGEEILEAYKDTPALDAGLLAAAQAVEHYEISRYGTLKRWAEVLGMKDAADLLNQSLEEESRTDELLSQLAESSVNQQAMAAE